MAYGSGKEQQQQQLRAVIEQESVLPFIRVGQRLKLVHLLVWRFCRTAANSLHFSWSQASRCVLFHVYFTLFKRRLFCSSSPDCLRSLSLFSFVETLTEKYLICLGMPRCFVCGSGYSAITGLLPFVSTGS